MSDTEGAYHYNRGANNIFKGHHAGIKTRNICPLTIAVTSAWALSLKFGNLELYSVFYVSNSP